MAICEMMRNSPPSGTYLTNEARLSSKFHHVALKDVVAARLAARLAARIAARIAARLAARTAARIAARLAASHTL